MTDFKPIESNQQEYNSERDKIQDVSSEDVKKHLLNAYETIKPFVAILDCEIVQFFNRNHWNLLPPDWRDYLTSLNVDKLADLMDCDCVLSTNAPTTLLAIRQGIKDLSLPRGQQKYHRLSAMQSASDEELQGLRDVYVRETDTLPFYNNLMSFDKKTPPLSLLKYKCKDKKLAEIAIMGDLCFKASLKQNVDFIIDIGAGLGHLSRCLAYFYGVNVVTIEMDAKMTEEALRLDEKFLKILKSLGRKDPKYDHIPPGSISRITSKITPDITAKKFQDLIEQAMSSPEKEPKPRSFKFGLVGLHPCGNLAPTMLDLYKTCDNCKFINLASCCYNKMTTEDNQSLKGDGFIGFPLNQLRKEGTTGEVVTMRMGRNQLGLALHALETHQERFRVPEGTESFKADFYRALVEKFIEEVAPEFRDTRRKNVKTIGPGGVTTFREYICQSIPEIKGSQDQDSKDHFKSIDDHLRGINEKVEFHRIMAFSAVRHMFAPLLETIVLLDRLLYLKNDSSECYVSQRFEPRISPRVHVITAFKQRT